jgi:hypothetical protein
MQSLRLSSVRKKAVHECGEAIVDWIIYRGSSAGSVLRGQTIVHRVYLRDTQNLSSWCEGYLLALIGSRAL